MDKRLTEVLEGKGGNYLFPFMWLHEGGREGLTERIRRIQESGCGAFCVESRPHEEFGRQGWWDDMAVILQEARKRDMKVWILDDKHFPTGYANGILKEKYPERRRWFVREHHVDVAGPMQGAAVLVPKLDGEDDEELLGAVAYRRGDAGDLLAGEGIPLEDMAEGLLFWDVPEGFYRIFFLIRTRKGNRDYVNGIDRESVQALIEAVYEPHYAHFSEYFGNTLAGFFSDEPELGSPYLGPWGQDAGFYYRTVGQPGMELPWSDGILGEMAQQWDEERKPAGQQPEQGRPAQERPGEGKAPGQGRENEGPETRALLRLLPGLWYPMAEDASAQIRLSYMDAVTKLWQRNFSMQLGEWCRAHGVLYTGHVIEDMNAHMRLGCSAGHYFRALAGQDMSGIDIVLHQVMPGFADLDVSARIADGTAGHEFFHYVLPKLGTSLARIEPRMRGVAMCEVFGAYGWAEDTACMKWLMDFLLVRGITRFVPHAFTDLYPDKDCPPHFYAQGNNPQYEGFSELMGYVNRVSHLLEGADLQTDGAVFYMAEAEWMSAPFRRTMDTPSKMLYDAHVDFDFLPLDALREAAIKDGRLVVNGHSHRFLAIPYAERYPQELHRLAERFSREGLPIFWLREEEGEGRINPGSPEAREGSGAGKPEAGRAFGIQACGGMSGAGEREAAGAEARGKAGEELGTEQLVSTIWEGQLAHLYTEGAPHLRIGHFVRGSASWFMLFWEDVREAVDETIQLPCQGDFLRLDLLNGKIGQDYTSDGRVGVRLVPYQSEILLFDELSKGFLESLEPQAKWEEADMPGLLWEIALLEEGKEDHFRTVRERAELFAITGRDGWPRFSGRMRYRTKLFLTGGKKAGLDLGRVGGTAKLTVNGRSLGMRICPPYMWDISEAAREGENLIEVEVANTLVHRIRERFSEYMQIAPSGLLGPVRLYR